MSSLAISGIVFACIFGGMILGTLLRAILPEKHPSVESKDLVKLGMGLIGTMTALVLGLLVAPAKSSFDTQRNRLAQLAGNLMLSVPPNATVFVSLLICALAVSSAVPFDHGAGSAAAMRNALVQLGR